MDDKNAKPGRKAKTRIPAWARAKRPKPQTYSFRGAPQLSPDSDLIMRNSLRATVERFAAGDNSLVREASPRVLFQPMFNFDCPQPHYLESGAEPGNRLHWWEKSVPASGPLSTINSFECQFHPALRSMVSWEEMTPESSPNEKPGLGFTVVPSWPESVPLLQNMRVTVLRRFESAKGISEERIPGDHTVLVNAVDEDYRFPNPQAPWPPLTIVFDEPQRAVGLEYGFNGQDEEGISAYGFKLVAYDRQGLEITAASSDGGGPATESLGKQIRLRPGEIFHRIGVRHDRGDIKMVKLVVTGDREGEIGAPGQPIRTPQIIHKVWHEPLPAAAVTQEHVEIVRSVAPPAGVGPASVVKTLPFGCDQCVVLLRGFKVAFLDGQPHPIRGLRLELDVRNEDREIYIAPSNRSGLLTSTPYPPQSVKLYYTLLAWDSRQVDLRQVPISGGIWFGQGWGAANEAIRPSPPEILRVPDPCGGQSCGLLFGAFTSIDIRFATRNLERLMVDCGWPLRVPSEKAIHWPVAVRVWDTQYIIFSYHWKVHGVILTGPGLTLSPFGVGIDIFPRAEEFGPVLDPGEASPLSPGNDPRTRRVGGSFPFSDPCGVRPPPENDDHFVLNTAEVTDFGVAWPLEAQMAFPVLRGFITDFENNPVRELELEFHSRSYDGTVMDWEFGSGRSGDEPDSEDCFPLGGRLGFAGVIARRQHQQTVLWVQDGIFDAAPGFVSLSPSRFGALHNQGPGNVLITGLTVGGPEAERFNLVLGKLHPGIPPWGEGLPPSGGVLFTVDQFYQQQPLRLVPGQALFVGGSYYTETETPGTAWLDVVTNLPEQRLMRIIMTGRPIAVHPSGNWLPPHCFFGNVQTGRLRRMNTLISSDGQTPLLVNSLSLANQQAGFSILSPGVTNFPARRQIDAGASWMIPVFFAPAAAGDFNTQALAETNAGTMTITLEGVGV
jgi:hypothetical protein